MPIKQLRNHIPIGGPARREPTDGTETDLRVSLGFEPKWFVERCGVNLGERWHKDPQARHDALATMKDELTRSFPGVPYWRADDNRDLWTISGVYGAYPVPHMFGIPLRYYDDRWPELDPDRKLSVEEIERLEVETVLASPVLKDLFRQIDEIQARGKPAHGYMNWQGVLNNAFSIRGQEIFLDIYERPDFVHRFFDLIARVMVEAAQQVQQRQRDSGFLIDQFSISNCVVNMISPEDYATFVKPRDEWIGTHFDRFGIHTCNWDITPYIEPLSQIPRVGYLDMGMVSDMKRVRETFPDTRRAVMYSPWKLDQAPLDEIRADMEQIYRELAPCDLVMADVQWDTPDERVQALLNICKRLEESGIAE